jgi:PIN domain nuclease of toxin-antitoxin system
MGPLRLLLDTHTLYWWHRGDPALSASAQAAIADSENVSAITEWEFITKFRSGKQPEFAGIAADVAAVVASRGFIQLPITMRHIQAICHPITGTQWIDSSSGRQSWRA